MSVFARSHISTYVSAALTSTCTVQSCRSTPNCVSAAQAVYSRPCSIHAAHSTQMPGKLVSWLMCDSGLRLSKF